MAITVPIGTVATFFNNSFINTDPYYVKNLSLWRHVLLPPESPDITRVTGIKPVVVQQNDSAKTLNVSFNIVDLPLTATLSQKGQAHQLLVNPSSNFPGFAPQGQSIKTQLPVKHIANNTATVLYFDITALPREEIGSEGDRYSTYGSRKNKISVKPYNGSNGVFITSEAPMVDEVIGSTATFSFDITKLSKV